MKQYPFYYDSFPKLWLQLSAYDTLSTLGIKSSDMIDHIYTKYSVRQACAHSVGTD